MNIHNYHLSHRFLLARLARKLSVTGLGRYTGEGATVQQYSDIQQAIYDQAVKPIGRFNDRT